MRGTCLMCGCTQLTPCDLDGEPCAWIDEQEDLCTRCALALLNEPIERDTPHWKLVLHLRVHRWIVRVAIANTAEAEDEAQIWTPGE